MKLLKSLLVLLGLAAAGLSPAAARAADDQTNRPIRALLVCGGCCHDYLHQKKIIAEGISALRERRVDDRP